MNKWTLPVSFTGSTPFYDYNTATSVLTFSLQHSKIYSRPDGEQKGM